MITRTYHGPTGRAPRHLPFRRAALSFMRWQTQRGLLNPLDASPPGSVWWRAVNERLLRDGCESVALAGGLAGETSSQPVRLWLEFITRPTARNWYRAHNASIVSGYLEHRGLAAAESPPERFFMNVALVRVLYAHALVAAPRLAVGRFAPLARLLGDPRLGGRGLPLTPPRGPKPLSARRDVETYIADEQRLGRLLDYAVIAPRTQRSTSGPPRSLGTIAHGGHISLGHAPGRFGGAGAACSCPHHPKPQPRRSPVAPSSGRSRPGGSGSSGRAGRSGVTGERPLKKLGLALMKMARASGPIYSRSPAASRA